MSLVSQRILIARAFEERPQNCGTEPSCFFAVATILCVTIAFTSTPRQSAASVATGSLLLDAADALVGFAAFVVDGDVFFP